MVGSAKLGAVLGTFLGGGLMVCYGRRATIAMDSFFFVLGPVTMAFSSSLMYVQALRAAGQIPDSGASTLQGLHLHAALPFASACSSA